MIRKGILKAFDGDTYKASVQVIGSLSVWLDNVTVSAALNRADMVAGRSVVLLSLDPSNPDDCILVGLWGVPQEPPAPGAHENTHTDGASDEIDSALDPRAYPLLAGTLANRPAAGVDGRFFWTTDEHILYRDNGTSWVKVAVADHADLDGVGASDHHAKYTDAEAKAAAVDDTAYGVGWNGVIDVAPSKNAVYDEMQQKLENVVEDTTPQLGGDLDCQNNKFTNMLGFLMKTATEVTIATGAITITQMFHTLDTEGDAPSDDLDTINGGGTVNMIVIRAANDARTVVVKHNTGNIWLQGKADISLDDLEDGLLLVWDGTKWFDIAAGGGGDGGSSTWVGLTDTPGSITANQFVRGNAGGTALEMSSTLLDDLNFAKFKAIAMVCDNGATVPASPTTGQWFLHTPTGRKILMMYDGSNWIPIISIGAMTVYVDGTDGSDSIDKGGAADSGAFKTVQYAVNQIPGLVGGNVTININAETYNEDVVIRGKMPTGDYTITLQGTLSQQASGTATGKTQGSGANHGTLTHAGQFGGYDNMIVYITAADEYRIIDSDTADVITIVEYFSDATNKGYVIYDWGTVIDTIEVAAGQKAVVLNHIAFTGSGQAVDISSFGEAILDVCKINSSDTTCLRCLQGRVAIYECYAKTTQVAAVINIAGAGYGTIRRTKVDANNNLATGMYIADISIMIVEGALVLDGSAGANKASSGIQAFNQGSINCAVMYSKIRNFDTGVATTFGGNAIYTWFHQYSGNTTNESAHAASYSYID